MFGGSSRSLHTAIAISEIIVIVDIFRDIGNHRASRNEFFPVEFWTTRPHNPCSTLARRFLPFELSSSPSIISIDKISSASVFPS